MIGSLSFVPNKINFKGYTEIGEGSQKTKNQDYSPCYDAHTRKQDIKNSLCVGALAGAIIATAGVSMYKDHQIKSLLNEMAEEMTEGVDSIKIQDITKDSIPEIVLMGNDGMESVYDLTSGSVYFKDGSDIVEKVR